MYMCFTISKNNYKNTLLPKKQKKICHLTSICYYRTASWNTESHIVYCGNKNTFSWHWILSKKGSLNPFSPWPFFLAFSSFLGFLFSKNNESSEWYKLIKALIETEDGNYMFTLHDGHLSVNYWSHWCSILASSPCVHSLSIAKCGKHELYISLLYTVIN